MKRKERQTNKKAVCVSDDDDDDDHMPSCVSDDGFDERRDTVKESERKRRDRKDNNEKWKDACVSFSLPLLFSSFFVFHPISSSLFHCLHPSSSSSSHSVLHPLSLPLRVHVFGSCVVFSSFLFFLRLSVSSQFCFPSLSLFLSHVSSFLETSGKEGIEREKERAKRTKATERRIRIH